MMARAIVLTTIVLVLAAMALAQTTGTLPYAGKWLKQSPPDMNQLTIGGCLGTGGGITFDANQGTYACVPTPTPFVCPTPQVLVGTDPPQCGIAGTGGACQGGQTVDLSFPVTGTRVVAGAVPAGCALMGLNAGVTASITVALFTPTPTPTGTLATATETPTGVLPTATPTGVLWRIGSALYPDLWCRDQPLAGGVCIAANDSGTGHAPLHAVTADAYVQCVDTSGAVACDFVGGSLRVCPVCVVAQ